MTLRVLSFNSMNIANPVMMYRNRFQEIHRKCFMDRAIMFPVGSFFSWLQLRYLLCKNASYNINFSFLFCFFFNFLPLSIRYATGEHAHTQWVSASVHVSRGRGQRPITQQRGGNRMKILLSIWLSAVLLITGLPMPGMEENAGTEPAAVQEEADAQEKEASKEQETENDVPESDNADTKETGEQEEKAPETETPEQKDEKRKEQASVSEEKKEQPKEDKKQVNQGTKEENKTKTRKPSQRKHRIRSLRRKEAENL